MEAAQAEILLLEWHLPEEALKDLMLKIHHLSGQYKVIFFARSLEESEKISAVGTDYVILKNAPPDELLPILKRIDMQSTNV